MKKIIIEVLNSETGIPYKQNASYVSDSCYNRCLRGMKSLQLNEREYKYWMDELFEHREKGTITFVDDFIVDERLKEVNQNYPDLLGLKAFVFIGIPIILSEKPEKYVSF